MKEQPKESLCIRCFKHRCIKKEFGNGPDEDCRPFDEVLYVKDERPCTRFWYIGMTHLES